MTPALAAFLFHAPGIRFLTNRRLTSLGVKLNLVAVTLTLIAMATGFVHRGFWGLFLTWAIAHGLWSIIFAASVGRLTSAYDERSG